MEELLSTTRTAVEGGRTTTPSPVVPTRPVILTGSPERLILSARQPHPPLTKFLSGLRELKNEDTGEQLLKLCRSLQLSNPVLKRWEQLATR